jgi:hypothetical protein
MKEKREFQSGDKVRISDGDYKDQEATILASTGHIFDDDSYMVRIGEQGRGVITGFSAKELVLIESDIPF